MWKNFQITYIADSYLATTSTATVPSSITTSTAAISTIATTQQTSFQCYDCSGSDCDKEDSSLRTNCLSCTLSRNPDDQSKASKKSEKYSFIDNMSSSNRTTLLLVVWMWSIKHRQYSKWNRNLLLCWW